MASCQRSAIHLEMRDVYGTDDPLLVTHFDGDGGWVAAEIVEDPEITKLCVASFEAVWRQATPHSEYHPSGPHLLEDQLRIEACLPAERIPRCRHAYSPERVDPCCLLHGSHSRHLATDGHRIIREVLARELRAGGHHLIQCANLDAPPAACSRMK